MIVSVSNEVYCNKIIKYGNNKTGFLLIAVVNTICFENVGADTAVCGRRAYFRRQGFF